MTLNLHNSNVWHALTWDEDDRFVRFLFDRLCKGPCLVEVKPMPKPIPWYERLFSWFRRRWMWLTGAVLLAGAWKAGKAIINALFGRTGHRPIGTGMTEDRAKAEKERIKAHADAARDEVNARADDLLERIKDRFGE